MQQVSGPVGKNPNNGQSQGGFNYTKYRNEKLASIDEERKGN